MSFVPVASDRLLALINQANPHLPTPVTKSNLYLGGARLDPSASDGKSSIVPTTGVLGTVYHGYQDFKYQRINLTQAYDYIPVMRSVGADTLYNMLDIVNAYLGLNFTQDDVVDTNVARVDAGASVNINIIAKPTSLGYTGSMVLEFQRITPELSSVIRSVSLDTQNYDQIDPTLNKLDIGMQMWNVDMSPFFSTTASANALAVSSNGTWANLALLKAAIQKQFGYTDWPTPAANTVTDYATSKYPGANTNFERVVVQKNVVGGTYVGAALFHYNQS
jgi:hypothetical protein